MCTCDPSALCACPTASTYALPAVSARVTVCEVVDMRTNAMIKSPLELAAGNATDMDPNPDPWREFACTNPMPPPPDALIVILSALVPVRELASVTCTVKLLVPAAVGVPEITPVAAARESP